MIKIENVEVVGWRHAIRGMRNPLNSWKNSDSEYAPDVFISGCNNKSCDDCAHKNEETCLPEYTDWNAAIIGPNDHQRMMNLSKAGSDHAKYRRMIVVYLDIIAPLYWWKEFDTYKVGTVANSCSTMHKIAEKEFTLDDFSWGHLLTGLDAHTDGPTYGPFMPLDVLSEVIIPNLNRSREAHLKAKKKKLEDEAKKYWWQMIQLLPSSYNQRRTIMLNYEVLANMYHARKNHKLDEWREFCKWIESLPYSEIITKKE